MEENRDVELAKAAPAGLSRIGLSPDGKQLAFTSHETLSSPWKICLVSPAGGPIREIYVTKAGEVIQWFHWTPDGREIWLRKFTRAADEKSKPATAFLSISPDGRIIRTLDPSLMATGNNSIHSDGRQLAYEAGAARVELWALENFLK